MKIELTQEECHNVRVALRAFMKDSNVNENGMKQLLTLSDKFIHKDLKAIKDEKNRTVDKK